MKILIVNNVFHSVMADTETDPPASETIDGLSYTAETVQVTSSLKAFYPSCTWDGSGFSVPAQNQLSAQEVTDYWADVDSRLND